MGHYASEMMCEKCNTLHCICNEQKGIVMIKRKTVELKRSDLSDNMKNILAILQDNKTRSTRDLYQSLAIPVTTLRKALNRLHLFELVDEMQNHNGNLWTITKKGLMLAVRPDESNEKQQQPPELSRQEAEFQLPDQEAVIGLPNEKKLKPAEKFSLNSLVFWLRTKAKELSDMAELIESNKDSINVKQ